MTTAQDYHFRQLTMRFGPANGAQAMTLLGVTRLAVPELVFEIEATAVS